MDKWIGADNGDAIAIWEIGHIVHERFAGFGDGEDVRMIEALQIIPFPTAMFRRTLIEQQFRASYIVEQPLRSCLSDIAEVHTALRDLPLVRFFLLRGPCAK